jgi:raffinose/stachyose/melibiose transport system permease protein
VSDVALAHPRNRKRFHLRNVGPKLIATLLALALAAVFLGPMYLVIITSIKSNKDFLAGPFALPSGVTFESYRQVWQERHFGELMSRFNLPGKTILFGMFLTGLMLPQQTVLIPLYAALRTLHLLDSKIGLIIVHGIYGMPAQILILRGFMTAIPSEIEKAARIEGATDFQVFWKVILPLSVPGIIVGYSLNFIAIWKEFVFGLVFLNHEANYPVTVGMLKLNSDRYMSVFNLPAAGLVISQIPIVILFILCYRKLTSGNFVGAVKG